MILTKELGQVTLEKSSEGTSGRTGIAFVYHSLKHFGVEQWSKELFAKRQKGNRAIAPEQKILAGALSIIAGGENVEDIEVLRSDSALLESMGWRGMVGADALRRFLANKITSGKLRKLSQQIAVKSMAKSKIETFTYDIDATYFESNKDSAEYSYRKSKDFSGLLGFIAELGICSTVDFIQN